jgi:starch synthase
MGSLGRFECGLLEGSVPGSRVPVYFVDYAPYFRRQGIYTERGEGYPDNGERFVFLSRASLELCRATRFSPDLIHVHDWHTASVPVFLDAAYRDDPVLGAAASLLTLHNLLQQGVFDKGLMDVLDVGWGHFRLRGMEFFGRVNLLKGGIYHATLINTVSPTYAREILQPEFALGIEGVIRDREADLSGILNGADYEEWNPETDPRIAANYSEGDLSGKALCKGDLQRALGLPEKPDVPLLGMVSRLVRQKGIDLLAGAAQRLVGTDVQLVLLGSGEPGSHDFFEALAREHPGNAACRIGFDDGLAHRIIAGADFFLMPSRVEPCGLTQMYAMRYGTLPIVRATGGLRDTVEDAGEAARTGTGFTFGDATPEAFLDAIGRAASAYRTNRAALAGLLRNAMTKRFTWASAADRYEGLYAAASKRRRDPRRGTGS